MKITYLKKRIIKSFSIAGALLVVTICSIYFKTYQVKKSQETINKIKGATSEIKSQTESLQNKMLEIKKYKEVWGTISENQKNQIGIKIDNINSKLEQMANQHNIFQPNIKVSFPENLKEGVFNISSSDIVSSSVDISFIAITDVEALMFISDLIKSLPGYVIVNKLSIRKTRDYNNDDLIKISSGTGTGFISCEVSFYWYVYKPKTIEDPSNIKQEADKSKQNNIFE